MSARMPHRRRTARARRGAVMVALLAAPALALAPRDAQAEPAAEAQPSVTSAAPLGPAPAPPASAPPPSASPPRSNELRYVLAFDLPITIVGGGWLLGSELAKQGLAPSSCNWCEVRPDGSDALNGFDAYFRGAFVRRDPSAADTTSNILGYGAAPVSAIALLALAARRDEGSFQTTPIDLLLTAEATVLAMDVNQTVKFLVARERPYLHFSSADARQSAITAADSRLSFYSLHTSATFALAVSAGTVAELRGYSIAPLIFGSGLLIGTATGYMRMAADKHYMSDVLVGAAMGSAIGFIVPYTFHHPLPGNARLSATPMPGGGVVGASGAF